MKQKADKKIIVPGRIVTNDSEDRILKGHFVEIENNLIKTVSVIDRNYFENYDGEIFIDDSLVLIPGFIQTHVHICQTLFRGLADDLELLDWLQYKIFPFENAHDKNSLKISTQLGINELLAGGTTCFLDMGTLRHQEIIFEELTSSGVRGFAGNCLIDQNDLFPEFKSNTKDQIKYTRDLAQNFHNASNGKIKFGFAPRFVLSCTETLLKESHEMKKDFYGSFYHTHSSENKNEVKEVRNRFGKENIEYFESIGVIDENSVLAHCIHLKETEINLLKNNKVRVSHCPSSNLKLGSGFADIPKLLKEEISVSLGADGAPCNNNLSIFNEMRLASFIQKPKYGADILNAKRIFKLATIDAAKALHLENEIGIIEAGKKADLVLLNLNSPFQSYNENDEGIYSDIVYSAGNSNVHSVLIDGKWKVKNYQSQLYNDEELLSDAKIELKKLLTRM